MAGSPPKREFYIAPGHIAHGVDTVAWLVEGVLGKGWNMDCEGLSATDRTGGERGRPIDQGMSALTGRPAANKSPAAGRRRPCHDDSRPPWSVSRGERQ